MRTTDQKALETFLAEQILPKLRAVYQAPAGVRTDQEQKHWFASLYLAVVGLTTDQKLIYQAWINVTRSYKGKTWPPPGVLCDAIKELAPDLDRAATGGKASKRPDGKNSFEMGEYVRANHVRVLDEWWDYNGDSADLWPVQPNEADRPTTPGPEALIVALIADEKRASEIRGAYRRIVGAAAHYHAQHLYWGLSNSPLDLTAKGFDYWLESLHKEVTAIRARHGGGTPARQLPAPNYARLARDLMGQSATREAEAP